MSIFDYDLAEAKKQFNSVITSLVMMSVMHFWLKFTQPLIIQALLPWKNFFSMPVVKIRVLGYAAEGNLKRPWKTPSPFGDLMNQMSEEGKDEGEESNEVEKKAIAEKSSEKKESAAESASETESKASGVKARKPRKEE